MDNEFDLIFVVAFQKILQLSYVDKFLSDIQLEFRDKYKNELSSGIGRSFQTYDFVEEMRQLLSDAEQWGKLKCSIDFTFVFFIYQNLQFTQGRQQAQIPKQMRTFTDSQKSKKTVASMIERKGDEKEMIKKTVKIVETKKPETLNDNNDNYGDGNGGLSEDILMANRRKLAEKLAGGGGKKKIDAKKSPKSPTSEKAGKKPRVWELGGNTRDLPVLDRSKDKPEDARSDFTHNDEMIGTMKGVIQDLEVESEDEDNYDESSSDENDNQQQKPQRTINQRNASTNSTTKSSMFSLFKGLVGAKNLTRSDMQPALDKLRDHLIGKNVASDIAYKLCESVATKLEGKVLGTFETVAATVKTTITDALVQILSPKRRVDILRDCLEAKRNQRPYVMSFCGVNGVGKSTNLAKICFWLIENNLSVLIAACDTFRAGAVEQLRTHVRHLNALHPPEKHMGHQMVQLYEKGYGKDAAGIAMEAIRFATDCRVDVVLIDTAGRMQDNEPLMRALAKLIKVNA